MSRVSGYLSDGESVIAEASRSRVDAEFLKFYAGTTVFAALAILAVVGVLPVPAPSLVAAGLVVLALVPAAAVEVIRYAHNYYFTDRKVIELTGVFSVTTTTIYYNEITHTGLKQRWWDRILGHGDITIDTAGEGKSEMILRAVPDPGKYQNILEGRRRDQHGDYDTTDTETGGQSTDRSAFTKDHLEAELGRIEHHRSQLEQQYNNGDIDRETYEQRWYRLDGEKRQVERLLGQYDS